MSVTADGARARPRARRGAGEARARDPWVHRAVPLVRFRQRVLLFVLLALGGATVVRLFEWWFRGEHVASLALYVLLSLAFWYGVGRVLLSWFAYAGVARPAAAPAPAGARVAIFTTSAPGEPFAMFERTLAACARVRYPHTTYLLDDTLDPAFRELAARHGAVWLELVGVPGAKAGKINRALELTDEEFILVLDPDHVPFPEIFDRVLGHFGNERVGFVQVAQAYYNQERSFVARAAAEQTYAFYGPLMMGMHGHRTSVAIGANCVFRRAALESIDGHGVGLAEDLVTAVRLHARGWRSVYLPEVLSRGLVPEELGSYYRQQLKWARGVYEVLFAELPRCFGRLTLRQRLAYLGIGTYYLCGLTTLFYLVLPYLYLWIGIQPAAMRFEEFAIAGLPVAAAGTVIYLFAQRWLCHPAVERGLHWRGMFLKLACWPVYLLGTVLAVLRIDVRYTPTPKAAVRGRFLQLAWPHLAVLGAYAATMAHTLHARLVTAPEGALVLTSEAVWGMAGFATLGMLGSWTGVYAAWQAGRAAAGEPWAAVPRGPAAPAEGEAGGAGESLVSEGSAV